MLFRKRKRCSYEKLPTAVNKLKSGLKKKLSTHRVVSVGRRFGELAVEANTANI